MEQQTGSAPSQQETTGGSSTEETQARTGQELMDELARLGNKFVEVVDVAWNSDQRRRAEDDLRKGLETLATSLEDGIKKLSETKQARELIDTAEDVAESMAAKMRTSKVANELAGTLAQGLHSLSEQMDRLAKDIKSKGEAQSQAGTPPPPAQPEDPQDIPISRE